MKIKVGDKFTRRSVGEVTAVSEKLQFISVRFDTGEHANYSLRYFEDNFLRAPVQRKTKKVEV